jgi:hypothetical protein
MSLHLLVQGILASDPKPRQSSTGKTFATALLKVAVENEEPVLVSAIAFNQSAVAKLMALHKGDALAMTGPGKLTSWIKDGETKRGLGITAESVLSIYEIRKRKTEMAGQQEAELPAYER